MKWMLSSSYANTMINLKLIIWIICYLFPIPSPYPVILTKRMLPHLCISFAPAATLWQWHLNSIIRILLGVGGCWTSHPLSSFSSFASVVPVLSGLDLQKYALVGTCMHFASTIYQACIQFPSHIEQLSLFRNFSPFLFLSVCACRYFVNSYYMLPCVPQSKDWEL